MQSDQHLDREQLRDEDERPPVFRTWNQLYAFVLILHAVIIALFYLFTRAYS